MPRASAMARCKFGYMLETLRIPRYWLNGSDNPLGAGNQQATRKGRLNDYTPNTPSG